MTRWWWFNRCWQGSGDERTEDGKTKCNMGAKHQQPENLCLPGENGREMGTLYCIIHTLHAQLFYQRGSDGRLGTNTPASSVGPETANIDQRLLESHKPEPLLRHSKRLRL